MKQIAVDLAPSILSRSSICRNDLHDLIVFIGYGI